jgi:multimeric flavodoxin WrbA
MKIRRGQAPPKLTREIFGARFRDSFDDPAFDREREAIARVEEIAWLAYRDGRKAPRTRPAGPGHADPSYELSIEWMETRAKIDAARAAFEDSRAPSRALLVNGSPRNDGTCPGEASKTHRLAEIAGEVLRAEAIEVDVLDLSLLASEYGRRIHPCKGCVSTAMPLCHWPCSCYPNHGLGQAPDWMAEIYERWTRAHGVLIATPVHWYQTPTGLKSMIDRLVCADGGNPDPTSTSGKDATKAKELEMRGWPYPKHLAGRVFGLVVHGDVAGVESVRHALADWLEWMGLIAAGTAAKLERYIGYYEPYATSHDALDRDEAVQEETRNVARALARGIGALRSGAFSQPDRGLSRPRPK